LSKLKQTLFIAEKEVLIKEKAMRNVVVWYTQKERKKETKKERKEGRKEGREEERTEGRKEERKKDKMKK
jgi:hypothetical protein